MFILDNAAMREIDARTIEAGTPGLHLMERAGAGAVRELLARPDWLWGTTLIVCGKGNNGGDGMVVARLLRGEGHAVEVLLAAQRDQLEGDARINLLRLREADVPVIELGDDPAAALEERLEQSPGRLLIDAGLGTGFTPPLREPWSSLARAMRDGGRRVVALDAPTGLDGDTGAVDPGTPRADLTVSFGFPKWGCVLQPGRAHCGKIVRVDLGFPRSITEEVASSAPSTGLWVDLALAAGWWKPRAIDEHKYDAGSVLVVGGSDGMSGAVALATLGAYRAGAGLVEACVPGRQQLSVDVQCAEALVHGLAETESGGLSPSGLESIRERASRRDAMVLGPGGGPDLETAQLFARLVEMDPGPLVIDADGLGAFHRLQIAPRFVSTPILTPHDGELSRLLGVERERLVQDRRDILRAIAAEWNAVLLHKGAPTMVAEPTGTLAVIGSGGPGLATAGSGDVLAGIAGALLAAGHPAFEAAALAAYLHGLAGDHAERRRGVAGMLARDILEGLGPALLRIEGSIR